MFIRELGSKICRMGKGRKNMEIALFMMASLPMAKKKVVEGMSVKTISNTTEYLRMIRLIKMGEPFMKMVILMRECGKMGSWMAMAYILGRMGQLTKGNSSTARKMAKANIRILMGLYSRVSGKMGKGMEKAP